MKEETPYFRITYDASPEGSTTQIEVYESDENLDESRCVLIEYEPNVDESESIKAEFGLSKEELNDYLGSLKNIARNYSLSGFIPGSDDLYRVDLADDSITTNMCRWEVDSVPQSVEQIFDNLKNKASEQTILVDEL